MAFLTGRCRHASMDRRGVASRPGLRHLVSREAGGYVAGIAASSGVENFWSMLKRGIVGTYHRVSRKRL